MSVSRADEELTSALRCFVAVARYHNVQVTFETLAHDYAVEARTRTLPLLRKIARNLGLKLRYGRFTWNDLSEFGAALPALMKLNDGRWVVLSGFRPTDSGGEVVVRDLGEAEQGFQFFDRDQFSRIWDGEVILVRPSLWQSARSDAGGLKRFWLAFLQHRRLLRDVAIAALTMQVLALAMPLSFQLVIDKVLVHGSYSTLAVLMIGVLVASLLESILRFLHRYILLHVATKVDAHVISRIFSHLLSLPVDFFERTAKGVIVKHMQQAEKIRQFLSGRLFLTLLDAVSLVVFVPILFIYSVPLALVVVFGSGIIIAIILTLSKPFRRWLNELYAEEGRRQGLLVETIQGLPTVKSLALEPIRQREWDRHTARAILLQFRVGKLAASAQAGTMTIERLVQIAVIAFGAGSVLNGTMTVGALVAFQIMASRVSGPLSQLAGLVPEYQEAALAARMLGEVLDQPPERADRRVGARPVIEGTVRFSDVSFRYPGSSQLALDKLSVEIEAGSLFGIVGRSGSGKSTMTKLLLGFHEAQEGNVRLDGTDVREIDLVHLRSGIGVVLQENVLFHGSLRDNIAAGRFGVTGTQVVEAVRLAGALEFIEKMPRGLETMVEENGINFSGGQRQRIAIARALVTQPRILIFDEATSALDPETESIVSANLKAIGTGRTLIVISHRLTSHVNADRILVLDGGHAVAIGRHQELLADCNLYKGLWAQQNHAIRSVAG